MNVSRRYLRYLESTIARDQSVIIEMQALIKQLYANQDMLNKKINQTYALARTCAQVLIESDIEDAEYINQMAAELEYVLNNPNKSGPPQEPAPSVEPESPPETLRVKSDGKVIQFPIKKPETNS